VRLLSAPRQAHAALRAVLVSARRDARSAAAPEVRRDAASSAPWFDGWKAGGSDGEGGEGSRQRPTAPPRTWLLTTGWRRYGLLDPDDTRD